ncbi:MAG: undecaprenyl/decaprenyl-phosphate alpha-N-acetylglucosaminyl 1-phosphate transferase [Candidatus Levybacteria bacterium]|nr:undecaprenyl/decaprenyl-phosphate alpha-N-acetylglucosaminyl 1-phosphate transferase [Candidatus Levybacteria bacterium]
MNFFTLFSPFLISLIVALIVTPLTIKLAYKFKLVDDPKTHKHPAIIHKRVIPRAGGLPIFLAILVATIIFIPINFHIGMILFAGMGVVGVGLIDDKYDLSPYVRFATNILFAGVVVFSGITIPFVTNPLGGILQFSTNDLSSFFLPQILAIIWIVWVMNMLNWSKGVDGQMPGIAAVSAIVIGIASLRFSTLGEGTITVAELSFITAGASLGFLFFNFYPAKIFPGYSATILGFLIGILSILSGVKLATAILVMGIPTADALFTILRRTLSKKSPFWHDKGHLHHLLLKLGLSQRSIAVFYWSMSAALGIIALTLSSKGKLFAIILLVVLVMGGILTLKYLTREGKKL